jgi:predicted dehydrogenase
VGVIDRRAERAQRVAESFNLSRWGCSENGVVDWLDEIDAVTLAVSPHSHYEIAKSMLNQGKHVLSEKPMTMRVEEGRELVELSHQVGKVLAIVHNFQFARSLRKLNYMISTGEIGEVRGVWAMQWSNHERRLPTWYEELPLGLFYDESPHLMYLIRKVVDVEPTFLSAQITPSTSGLNTPAAVTAHFRSGTIPIKVLMNFEAPLSEWHLIVFGSKRLAAADIFRDVLVTVRNDRLHLARDILQTSFDAISTHLWGVVKSGTLLLRKRLLYGNDYVIDQFVRAIQQDSVPDGISAEDGLRVLELQHAIIERGEYV